MLKPLLRKIAGLKEKVQNGAKYDKINLADDVRARSPLAKSVVDRTARTYQRATLGEDVTVMLEEFDTNQPATLSIQEFVFTSVAENPAANLLTLEIIEGSEEAIEVTDNHIQITIDTDLGEESDHDSVKALIDGDAEASELITVEINAGEGATLVTAQESSEFRGAIA
tara:strand:+ start:6968 stop:7474 length:507 start_codon:yes stop_codon:yes gene_type:complete